MENVSATTDMIIMDQSSLELNLELVQCIRENKFNGGAQPPVFFEGRGDKQALGNMFGFAPSVDESILTVFQRVEGTLMIVDQLLDDPFKNATQMVSSMSREVSHEGKLLDQVKSTGERTPLKLKASNGKQRRERLVTFLNKLRELLPIFNGSNKDIRSTQVRRSLDANPPAGKQTMYLLDQEAPFDITAPSRCSNSKPKAPAAQPNNFLRDWLEITLIIDEPEGGGPQGVGQFVLVSTTRTRFQLTWESDQATMTGNLLDGSQVITRSPIFTTRIVFLQCRMHLKTFQLIALLPLIPVLPTLMQLACQEALQGCPTRKLPLKDPVCLIRFQTGMFERYLSKPTNMHGTTQTTSHTMEETTLECSHLKRVLDTVVRSPRTGNCILTKHAIHIGLLLWQLIAVFAVRTWCTGPKPTLDIKPSR